MSNSAEVFEAGGSSRFLIEGQVTLEAMESLASDVKLNAFAFGPEGQLWGRSELNLQHTREVGTTSGCRGFHWPCR